MVQAGRPRPRLRPLFLELGLFQRPRVRSDVVQEGEEGSPVLVFPGRATAHRATLGSGTAACAISARRASKSKQRAWSSFAPRRVGVVNRHRKPPCASRRSPGGRLVNARESSGRSSVFKASELRRYGLKTLLWVRPLQVALGEPKPPLASPLPACTRRAKDARGKEDRGRNPGTCAE